MAGNDILLMTLDANQEIPQHIKNKNQPIVAQRGDERIIYGNAGSKESPDWREVILVENEDNKVFYTLKFPKPGVEPVSATAKGNVAIGVSQVLAKRSLHHFDLTREAIVETDHEILIGLLFAALSNVKSEHGSVWDEINTHILHIHDMINSGPSALWKIGSHIATINNLLTTVANGNCLHTLLFDSEPVLADLDNHIVTQKTWRTSAVFLKEKIPVIIQYQDGIWIYGKDGDGRSKLTKVSEERQELYKELVFISQPKPIELKQMPANILQDIATVNQIEMQDSKSKDVVKNLFLQEVIKKIIQDIVSISAHSPAKIDINPDNLATMRDLSLIGTGLHQRFIYSAWGIFKYKATDYTQLINEASLGWGEQEHLAQLEQVRLALLMKDKAVPGRLEAISEEESKEVPVMSVKSVVAENQATPLASEPLRASSVPVSKPLPARQPTFFVPKRRSDTNKVFADFLIEADISLAKYITANTDAAAKEWATFIKDFLISPLLEKYQTIVLMGAPVLGGEEAISEDIDFLLAQLKEFEIPPEVKIKTGFSKLLTDLIEKLDAMVIELGKVEVAQQQSGTATAA